MILSIALPTLVIYITVLGLMFAYMRAINREEVERNMVRLAANYAARFDGAFREVAAIADATASFMERVPDLAEDKLFAQLQANVELNPLVYGSAMAFDPTRVESSDLYCPYVWRDDGGMQRMNIGRGDINWYEEERWQWWHSVRATGAPVWTDPYYDAGAGEALMVTYSAPFSDADGFRGVTTIDVEVEKLRQQVGRSIVGDTRFVILTSDGQYVYRRIQSEIMSGRSIFDIAADMGRTDIAEAARVIVGGETGLTELAGWADDPPPGWEEWTEPQWVSYAPIPSTGWVFASALPERVALAPVRSRMQTAAAALTATLVLIVVGILMVSRRLTRPIGELDAGVARIATGDLDHRVSVNSNDEIGSLAESVNLMAADLKDHTERFARQRSESREAMIFAMAKLSESRDDDTGKHLERICLYTEILAAELSKTHPDIDDNWVHAIAVTAALHDIGKVGIPDGVLKKPGKLTDEEYTVMKSHTEIGGETLLAVREQWAEDAFLTTAAQIALGHHERWDGTGYPRGLSGEEIAFAARLVAVADVYDALTSKRCYHEAMPHEKARSIIVEGSGKHFDPTVVAAFLAVEEDFRETADRHRGQ